MKTAIFSEALACDNKELFTEAESQGYDALILNYDKNNLYKLPSRNYYALQSLKSGIPIAGILFEALDAESQPESQVDKLTALVDVIRNMKINLLLISGKSLNQFDSEEGMKSAVSMLKFLCKYSEAYDITVAIYDDVASEILDTLMANVDMANLIYVDDFYGEYDLMA